MVAGWMRVLFVKPLSVFWVGVASLRGDVRIVSNVLSAVLLFVVTMSTPFSKNNVCHLAAIKRGLFDVDLGKCYIGIRHICEIALKTVNRTNYSDLDL
jgi:hypothetical protein